MVRFPFGIYRRSDLGVWLRDTTVVIVIVMIFRVPSIEEGSLLWGLLLSEFCLVMLCLASKISGTLGPVAVDLGLGFLGLCFRVRWPRVLDEGFFGELLRLGGFRCCRVSENQRVNRGRQAQVIDDIGI